MTNVVIVFDLPGSSQFLEANGPPSVGFTQDTANGRIVFAAAGPVPTDPNAPLIYSVTVRAVAVAEVLTTVTLTYNEFTQPVSQSEGTSFVSGT